MKPKRIGDIELEHNERALTNDWRVQHVGWWVFAVFIVAGLLGVFGGGPLSRAVQRDDQAGLELEYERIARWDAPLLMRLTILPRPSRDGAAGIWIANEYLQRASIESINPPPLRSVSHADRTLYEFPMGNQGSGTITFEFRPQRSGLCTLHIGRDEDQGMRVKQMILP